MYVEQRFDSGKVWYHIDQLPGCCGITLIHSIGMLPYYKRNHQKLYRDLHKHITKSYAEHTWDTPDDESTHLNRGKLIITDAINGESRSGACPARFCRSMGWDEIGKRQHNANSGRNITMFEWNREPGTYSAQ